MPCMLCSCTVTTVSAVDNAAIHGGHQTLCIPLTGQSGVVTGSARCHGQPHHINGPHGGLSVSHIVVNPLILFLVTLMPFLWYVLFLSSSFFYLVPQLLLLSFALMFCLTKHVGRGPRVSWLLLEFSYIGSPPMITDHCH